MCKDKLIIKIVDNIMSYFKYTLITIIEEEQNNLPIFNSVLNVMTYMNKDTYSYTLKDIDDNLFDKLIIEVLDNLY